MKPDNIKPPITPRKITSMGTGAPLPNNIGLSKLSDAPANNRYTVQIVANRTELAEYKYRMIGRIIIVGGNCKIASIRIIKVQTDRKSVV